MNWFEGGRRIISLLALLILAGGGAYVLLSRVDNRVVLHTSSPNDRPTWSVRECKSPNYDQSYPKKIQFGSHAEPRTVTMCFHVDEHGRIVIGYGPEQRIEPKGGLAVAPPSTYGEEMAETPYSSGAKAYIWRRMDEFKFKPAEAKQIVDGQWMIGWARFLDRVVEIAPWVAGSLFGLLAITGGIGWVIRGFAGVPLRSDFRADSENAKKLVPQRVSNVWISVAIAICLVGWGFASAITSTFGSPAASTEPTTIWSKAGQFLEIIVWVGVGITVAGVGGYGFGKLIQHFRPAFQFGGEKGELLGVSFLNLMVVIVASIPIGLYTPVQGWIDQLTYFFPSHGRGDDLTLAVLVICLLWPWIPLWALEQFDLKMSRGEKP